MTVAQYKIRQYMKDNNIKQKDLSYRLGYSKNFVSHLLNGITPFLENMKIIEDFLGIENEWHNGIQEKISYRYETIREANFMFYLKYRYRFPDGTISPYLRGKARPNDLKVWRDICEFFDIKNDWITEVDKYNTL